MTELSTPVRAFLNEVHFAVVATIAPDGMPHQTVVWYMLDRDDLIVNMPEGSLKHKHLQRDPRLSICIEDGFRYVTLSGSVTLEDDTARAIYGKLGQRYQSALAQRPAAPPSPQTMKLLSRKRIIARMKITRVQANGLG